MEKAVNTFNFKQFRVVNERSAMKVNTDGVLLGAAMTIKPQDRRLLDIGTGTGTIALMAAQRLHSISTAQEAINITAIDIDGPSAAEAALNFQASPWPDSLEAHHKPFEEFAADTVSEPPYDLIFSNPPYFDESLPAPDERKNAARHTSDGLSYRNILEFASKRLAQDGRVALVLPSDFEASLCRHARMCGLHLFRITRIRTVPRKAPSRIVAEFSLHRCEEPQDGTLTIMNEGKYTEEYLSLIHDFYLFA